MAMIKRIKEIKNIGIFSNFDNGASISLEKLTFIYGLNTYGKTTLTDIFQSLKNNDNSIIASRKTIPETNDQQQVILSIKEGTAINETKLSYKVNKWDQNSIAHHIEIFGTDFIHKNIFTGLTIQRGNKENFTQFILGEKGVSFAEKIKEKRQSLGNAKKDLKNKIPSFAKGKDEKAIDEFTRLSIDDLSKTSIENNLYEKKNSLNKEQERLKEPSKILDLEEPSKFNPLVINILEKINAVNTLLKEDYSDIKEESIIKLEQHINNFSEKNGAENWIKTGLRYCKDKKIGSCPFCGQKLENVRALIELYNSYFDEGYNSFINRIKNELKKYAESIEAIRFNSKSTLQTASNIIHKYDSLINKPDFTSTMNDLSEIINIIDENDLTLELNGLLKIIRSKIAEKKEYPYKKMEPIQIEKFEEKIKQYSLNLDKASCLIDDLIEKITHFKNQYKDSSVITKNIDNLNKSIAELEYRNARIEQHNECKEYIALKNEISKKEEEIKKLETDLADDQSHYLDMFFTEINKIFKKLGSKNFTLEKETDNRGHLPVYSLKVKFHGVDIPSEKLNAVFSESDRRALALSVFWVKLNLKNANDKSKTLVILDDPVTSFDDNRITNSINLFKDELDKISQLIVLTHYPHFIKRFFEITKANQAQLKFLELELNQNTSLLKESDIKDFISNDYEKVFLNIYGFINRTHTESIKTDLRPFLEDLYLPMVFAKKIKDSKIDCSSLEKMIDGIFDNDAKMKSKFHQFRTALNPDAHIFTTNNDEDVRNFAIELIDCLYSLKYEIHP